MAGIIPTSENEWVIRSMDLSYGREDLMLACYDSCLILAFALRKRFEGVRGRDRKVVGLSEFDVDKTFRLCDKLWEKRPDRDRRRKDRLMIDLCVKRDFNDKHGHRIAFPITRKEGDRTSAPQPLPVLTFIELIDKNLRPHTKIFTLHERATGWGAPLFFIEPQVDVARLTSLIKKGLIDEDDISMLTNFGDASSILDEREIVSLGRHESAQSTRLSLLWELKRWKKCTSDAFATLSGIVEIDDEKNEFASSQLWECWSFARECILKAGVLPNDPFWSDRLAYEAALQKLKDPKSRTDQKILNLILSAQDSPEDIWDNILVSSLGFSAFCTLLFANYFVGTLFKCGGLKNTLSARRISSIEEQDIKDAFEKLKQYVNVTKEDRPQKFNVDWIPGESGKLLTTKMFDYAPEDVWNGLIKIKDFINDAKTIADCIIENHIDPDIASLRIQEP